MPRHLSSLIDPVNVHLVSLTSSTKWSDMSSSLWSLVLLHLRLYPVANPDLQIRGGGAVIQTLREGGAQKHYFRPFGPQFGPKIRGDPGTPAPPMDLPLLP